MQQQLSRHTPTISPAHKIQFLKHFISEQKTMGEDQKPSKPSYTTFPGDQVPEAQRVRCIPSMSLTFPATPTLSYAKCSNSTN
jgi:hypothetical protein